MNSVATQINADFICLNTDIIRIFAKHIEDAYADIRRCGCTYMTMIKR